MIEVVRPGARTTVQDLGRPGLGRFGVPRGGAFDPWSARAANRLVGNPDTAALLEITLIGPILRFHRPAVVALVGDDFELELERALPLGPRENMDGREHENTSFQRGRSTRVEASEVLTVGAARSGVRCWLAIGGGIDVPEVLGSRSTDLAGGFGGLAGRALERGDRLSFFPSGKPFAPASLRTLPAESRQITQLRLLEGPDARLLHPRGLSSLAESRFETGVNSDRRGVRLEGAAVALAAHAPLRSQPMLPGAVEVMPSGELIVLGVDAPVTGGYPWVAQVIEADIARLAHLSPASSVRFEAADFATAAAAMDSRWWALQERISGR